MGYTNTRKSDISCERMDDFINFLDSSEYLKRYNNSDKDYFSEHPIEYKYNIYYLTLLYITEKTII